MHHDLDAELKFFRTTFFWPMTLKPGWDWGRGPGGADDAYGCFIKEQVKRLDATTPWAPEPDLLKHIPKPTNPEDEAEWNSRAYAEFTFFHDFVQQALFTGRKGQRPCRSSSFLSR
ncbi:MAG: hypothetical protein MUC58_02320 [Rhizobiaceae bacterium]|jgi:hypothetical protein|nr:hypothetical protein [Rhizobiaceae bacterium]